MYGTYYDPNDKIVYDQNNIAHIDEVFKVYVNAIIPRTPSLAEMYGKIQYYGALDLYTDEYLIMSLNHYYFPLAEAVAELLVTNATYLRAPFQNIPGFTLYVTGSLNRFTMMGYYSEWSGYGSTRLENPNQRKLEYYPLSWEQVGYPGPSLGYRALRIQNT